MSSVTGLTVARREQYKAEAAELLADLLRRGGDYRSIGARMIKIKEVYEHDPEKTIEAIRLFHQKAVEFLNARNN